MAAPTDHQQRTMSGRASADASQEGRARSASPRLRLRSATGAHSYEHNDETNTEAEPSQSQSSPLTSQRQPVYPPRPRSTTMLPPLAEMLSVPTRLAPRQNSLSSASHQTPVHSPPLTALSLDSATYGHRHPARYGGSYRGDAQSPGEAMTSMSSRRLPHAASLSPRSTYFHSTTAQPSHSYHSLRPPSRSRQSEDDPMSPHVGPSRHRRGDPSVPSLSSQPQDSTRRTAITALLAPSSPPPSSSIPPQPALAPTTYRPASSHSSREVQRCAMVIEENHHLDRDFGPDDFDNGGTASHFLLRTARPRSPMQVDWDSQAPAIGFPVAHDVGSPAAPPSAQRGGPSSHAFMTSTQCDHGGTSRAGERGGITGATRPQHAVHRTAAVTTETNTHGAGPPSDQLSPALVSADQANIPQVSPVSAPPPNRVFQDWLSDVARQTSFSQPDVDLERQLTSFLADRNETQSTSRFGGYGASYAPSRIDPSMSDPSLSRPYTALFRHFKNLSVEPQGVPSSPYMRYSYMDRTLEQRHRAVDDEWHRGESLRMAYRQGFDDGVIAERKRVATGQAYKPTQEPLFWGPLDQGSPAAPDHSSVEGPNSNKTPATTSSVTTGCQRRRAVDSQSNSNRGGKRQPISCNMCRLRKLKCDGVPPAPCTACTKRGSDEQCEYVSFIRRRGPGKKSDAVVATGTSGTGSDFGVSASADYQAGRPLREACNESHTM